MNVQIMKHLGKGGLTFDKSNKASEPRNELVNSKFSVFNIHE